MYVPLKSEIVKLISVKFSVVTLLFLRMQEYCQLFTQPMQEQSLHISPI